MTGKSTRLVTYVVRALLWTLMLAFLFAYGLMVAVALPNLSPVRVLMLLWTGFGFLLIVRGVFAYLARANTSR